MHMLHKDFQILKTYTMGIHRVDTCIAGWFSIDNLTKF